MRKFALVLAWLAVIVFAAGLAAPNLDPSLHSEQSDEFLQAADPAKCINCHKERTPGIVSDWQKSRHRGENVGCDTCHGSGHTSADDVNEVAIPTPETCRQCHAEKVEQFSAGKHAQAWTAVNATPAAHWIPSPLLSGMKGCGGCHKIGLKTKEEIERLKMDIGGGFGVASCDACHTRHTFSLDEARSPEACRTCHNGPDSPSWDMYAGSKHGVRQSLKQSKVISADAAAPTCQNCHMPDGNHAVKTAWGYFGVRLPVSSDPDWADDQATILTALGVLDPFGVETSRLDGLERVGAFRTSNEEWETMREEMVETCAQCHSRNFATAQLLNGDEMIRNADALMAEAIRIVAYLYEDGVLARPPDYEHAFPDLLALYEASSPIELKLYEMFQHHRAQAFKGVFHQNPEYAMWHGWSQMVKDLAEIKSMALDLRQ